MKMYLNTNLFLKNSVELSCLLQASIAIKFLLQNFKLSNQGNVVKMEQLMQNVIVVTQKWGRMRWFVIETRKSAGRSRCSLQVLYEYLLINSIKLSLLLKVSFEKFALQVFCSPARLSPSCSHTPSYYIDIIMISLQWSIEPSNLFYIFIPRRSSNTS